MTTVYIVIASGGDYDSSWQENLSVWLDRTAAELEVLRLNEQTGRLMGMLNPIRETYYAALKKNQGPFEELPAPPRGPAKPNKENRALHEQAIRDYNKLMQPIAIRNRDLQISAMNAAREAAKQKAIELGAIEDDLKVLGFDEADFSPYCRDADASYEIEELELK